MAASAVANFWSSVLSTDGVQNNPILFHHFSRERKSLSSTSTPTSTSNKSIQCQFCFTTSPPTPKVVVKRHQRDPISKLRAKKVFLFCSVCHIKMADRCFELKPREKPQQLEAKDKRSLSKSIVVTSSSESPSVSMSKSSEKKKKKRKEKEQNAGLLIPTSMVKNPPKPSLGFAKKAALLKMLKSSDEVKEDKLKSFLKN